jgi:hypothetical protein
MPVCLSWQAWPMLRVTDTDARTLLAQSGSLQQHQRPDGQRSPHRPLLVLLALGRLSASGSSKLPWSAAESALGELIAEFGPPSRTSRAQSAAHPFTRLRNETARSSLAGSSARGLGSAMRVLRLRRATRRGERGHRGGPRIVVRFRRARHARQRLGLVQSASQALRPGHPRTGPRFPGDGLSHVLGPYRSRRTVYDLHGRALSPRPGTALPAPVHVSWHVAQVFKGKALTA